MSIKWSFSSEKCFRQCQRQYYFRNIAAWHNGREPVRREAFILKQLKTRELWQGGLVHLGIERFVIPNLETRVETNWNHVIESTWKLALGQFHFSEKRRYREEGMSKTKAGDNYCALAIHEREEEISNDWLGAVREVIERCFKNLSEMDDLWQELANRGRYWAEVPLRLSYDRVHIEVRLDLLCFRAFGKPIIVDWKISESMGGYDARLQTILYAWALCQTPAWQVANAEDVDILEVPLLKGQIVRHKIKAEHFSELENRIYRGTDEIESLVEDKKFESIQLEDFDFTENPNSCKYCFFQSLCRQNATPTPKPKSRSSRARQLQPEPFFGGLLL